MIGLFRRKSESDCQKNGDGNITRKERRWLMTRSDHGRMMRGRVTYNARCTGHEGPGHRHESVPQIHVVSGLLRTDNSVDRSDGVY